MKNQGGCCYFKALMQIICFIVSVFILGLVIGFIGWLLELIHVFPPHSGAGYIVSLLSALILIWAYVRCCKSQCSHCGKSSNCHSGSKQECCDKDVKTPD
ncbi:MAG: hypothetical protein ACO2ZM_08495 [Francisellaceae bacterium]